MKNLIIGLSFIFMMISNVDNANKNIAHATFDTHAAIETQVTKSGCSNSFIVNPIMTSHPHPYNLKLDLNNLGNDVYDLEMLMELNDGAHFVSPNSKGNYKGIFTVQIDKSENIDRLSTLKETPLSVEEYDDHPFVNGYINWVRENTTYNQKIKRTSEKDFEVLGFIQFTIEPSCTLEKIPFIIKYKNGEMTFENFGC